MIKFLYDQVQNSMAKGRKYWPYQYKINKLLVNLLYPTSQLFNNKKGVDENSNVVISLTTYPARIKNVWITIASLLNQTYKPLKVVLYLSKEQFPNGLEELPSKLLKQQARGLEIVFVDGDLKPHKKYYYAFEQYNDKIVVTADDDIFYPEDNLGKLMLASEKYPDAVICSRSHGIIMDETLESFKEYNTWPDDVTSEPNMLSMPIGCNGVLYKPSLFDDEIFSKEIINQYTLFTDDLWLKAMEIKSGIKAYNYSKCPLVFFDNIFNGKTGLWHSNASSSGNRNDEAWNGLMNLYPEILQVLKKDI